jgi:uncharacterized Tic20 family protein
MSDAKPTSRSQNERNWGMAIHLSALLGIAVGFTFINFVVPLLLWTIKRENSRYLDAQGKEVVNFQLSLSLALLALWVLRFTIIAYIAYVALAIAGIALIVKGALAVRDGTAFHYPFSFRFFL